MQASTTVRALHSHPHVPCLHAHTHAHTLSLSFTELIHRTSQKCFSCLSLSLSSPRALPLLNWPAGKQKLVPVQKASFDCSEVEHCSERERERTRELQAGRERKRDLKALAVGRIESGTDTEQ